MSGALHPLPSTPSYLGAKLKRAQRHSPVMIYYTTRREKVILLSIG